MFPFSHLVVSHAPGEGDHGALGRVISPPFGLLGVKQAQNGGHVDDGTPTTSIEFAHFAGKSNITAQQYTLQGKMRKDEEGEKGGGNFPLISPAG